VLSGRGILPGIKVDKGAVDLAGHPGEKITEGLDGLRVRLAEYAGLGAVFAKWRAVITIGDGIPSAYCLEANAAALARYAALCQEAGIAPIVEPEVLMDGGHSIERCAAVTENTLRVVFDALAAAGVMLEGMLLKPNMVIAGTEASRQAPVEEVAQATIDVLRRVVPPAVPGIVFLSGGQTPQQATLHLNEMNRLGPHPWRLSFSYGRALQDEALKAWRGQPESLAGGQKAFQQRAAWTGAACRGAYQASLEHAAG
jgi:fructose-bisphosphate aldolase class I